MKDLIQSLFSLEGKVAAVTGAGGHLCSEMVAGLARAGCKVAVMDIRLSKAKSIADAINSELGDVAISLEVDASDKDSFTKGFDATLAAFGGADILINGAGINSATPFLDIDLEEFLVSDEFSDNLYSHWVPDIWWTHAKGWERVYYQHILCICWPPLSKAFTYSIAKAGIVSITQNLGREWGKLGVRVNAIRPGFFPTEWNKKNFITAEREAAILGHTPMARFGEVTQNWLGG